RVYVRELPREDQVMLASFGEVLWLRHPLARNKDSLGTRTLGPLPLSRSTSLWDSLNTITRYLEGRRERKVVVLLTDGCDVSSIHPFEEVLHRAARLENLVILPVVAGHRTLCPPLSRRFGKRVAPRNHLETLARRTGGQMFQADPSHDLAQSFRRIRERLDREGYVVFKTGPAGPGASDSQADRKSRWRKVSVKSAPDSECRVASAGPKTRWVEMVPPQAPPALTGLRVKRDAIQAEVRDLVRLPGFLYDLQDSAATGRLIPRENRKAVTATRSIEIPVPPFERIRGGIWAPEDVILSLFVEERPPGLVQGGTFFRIRSQLGELLHGFPGYKEWANTRLEVLRSARADVLLEDLVRDQPLSADTRAFIHARLVDRLPVAGEAQEILAEWLGDISARQLAEALERKAANAWIRYVARLKEEDRQTAVLIEDQWPQLAAWFPPPVQVRSLALLSPAYDPDRDVVGFYRVILPEPVAGGPPRDRVPERPVGLETVRWMLGRWGDDASEEPAFRLEHLEYRVPAMGPRRRYQNWLYQQGMWDFDNYRERVRSVVLRLVPPAGEGDVVRLEEIYLDVNSRHARRDDQVPSCFDMVPGDRPGGGAAQALRSSLVGIARSAGRLCREPRAGAPSPPGGTE
ncbi:MAG: hypothetical protein ACE5HD_11760, partial [Acidobacteriota bacterium]